ncbi:MAG TPA: c-type cytochrome [Mucilaginibacter sp.]
MKYLRLTLLLALSIVFQRATASNDSLIPADVQNYIGYSVVVTMLLLFVIAMLVVLKTIKVLTRAILKSEGYTEIQIIKETGPVKEKKKSTGEASNSIRFFRPSYLFYAALSFAGIYLLIHNVFGSKQLQGDKNQTKAMQGNIAKTGVVSKSVDNLDANTVKLTSDPAVLADGKTVFMANCLACHGPQGQGLVGPNLTDDYWLHGNTIGDIFKTIKNGVPAKAMPTWGTLLSAKQISDVANYVKSLHGTNPPNPKAPQGTKEL